MKKKMIIAVVFVAALAITASAAYAGCDNGWCGYNPCPCPDQSNEAYGVTNVVSAQAVSGGNTIQGSFLVAGGTIFTGTSVSKAKGINAVNSNVKTGFTMGTQTQENKAVNVGNGVTAASESGVNHIAAPVVVGGYIATNPSISKVKGINLVNTNLKLGW